MRWLPDHLRLIVLITIAFLLFLLPARTAGQSSWVPVDHDSILSAVQRSDPGEPRQHRAGVAWLETGHEGDDFGAYLGEHFARAAAHQRFEPGETVVLQVRIIDSITGRPLRGAVAEICVSGPEHHVLVTSPSDVDGLAEVCWPTFVPDPRGRGGTCPGPYTAAITHLEADDVSWDGVTRAATFLIR